MNHADFEKFCRAILSNLDCSGYEELWTIRNSSPSGGIIRINYTINMTRLAIVTSNGNSSLYIIINERQYFDTNEIMLEDIFNYICKRIYKMRLSEASIIVSAQKVVDQIDAGFGEFLIVNKLFESLE